MALVFGLASPILWQLAEIFTKQPIGASPLSGFAMFTAHRVLAAPNLGCLRTAIQTLGKPAIIHLQTALGSPLHPRPHLSKLAHTSLVNTRRRFAFSLLNELHPYLIPLSSLVLFMQI